jgi:hypothetical protein
MKAVTQETTIKSFSKDSEKSVVNPYHVIEMHRPAFAELLNIIAFINVDSGAEWSHETSFDCLHRVLIETVKAINLWDVHDFEGRQDRNLYKAIHAHIETQLSAIIMDPANNHEGMLYAIRNKPESILIYPVFKKLISAGWVQVNETSAYRDHLLKMI